ncbi:hypothetical protein CsSME_00012918 [Camellia sinensis var. sinensis]
MKNRKQKHNQTALLSLSLSLSLTYYCSMLRFLKDPTAIKMFRLVFDKPVAPTSELLKKLRTYSGVYFAEIVSDHNNEKKLFQAEITLKIDKNNTNNNRKTKKSLQKKNLVKSNRWI